MSIETSYQHRQIADAVRVVNTTYKVAHRKQVPVQTIFTPAHLSSLQLIVDPAMKGCSGIIRDNAGEPYLVWEDGTKVSDPREMRVRLHSLLQHIEEACAVTGCSPLAASSCGDLGMNEGHVGYTDDGQKRTLFCRPSELSQMRQNRLLFAIGEDFTGRPWAGCICFSLQGEDVRIYDAHGIDYTGVLRVLVTGKPVLWGNICDPAIAAPFWAADTRHVVSHPTYISPSGKRIVFGATQLSRNPEELKTAIRGRPISFELTWQDEAGRTWPLPAMSIASLAEDAVKRGYVQVGKVSDVSHAGQFAFDETNTKAVIAFLPGVYPFNLLGIDRAKRIYINKHIGGISTISGCTVKECGKMMRTAGAMWALAIDEGADNQFVAIVRGHAEIGLSFTYRAGISASLVWTTRK